MIRKAKADSLIEKNHLGFLRNSYHLSVRKIKTIRCIPQVELQQFILDFLVIVHIFKIMQT